METKGFDQPSWWYQESEETKGPVSEVELRRLVAAGNLRPDSPVWRESFGDEWRSLKDSGLVLAQPIAANVSDKWRKVFEQIEAAEIEPEGDRKRAWNKAYPFSLPGLIFGPLYYMYLRMWNRALLLIALGAFIELFEDLIHILISTHSTMKGIGFLPVLISGFMVKHDYYRFKVHGERVWAWKPLQVFRNMYAALALAACLLIASMLMPAEASDGGSSRESSTDIDQGSSYTLPSGATVRRHGNVMYVGAPPAPTRSAENGAGVSGAYCSNGKQVLESQTLQLREQSIPVDSALDAFVDEDNVDYQRFMMISVRQVYANPDEMRERLRDGTWMRACITAVRGF